MSKGPGEPFLGVHRAGRSRNARAGTLKQFKVTPRFPQRQKASRCRRKDNWLGYMTDGGRDGVDNGRPRTTLDT